MSQSTTLRLAPRLIVAGTAIIALTACVSSLSGRARDDPKAARAEVEQILGAKQVLNYSVAVERAVELNVFGRETKGRDETIEDAIAKLTAVIDSGHPDAPVLLAHRGVLHCIADRCDQGQADLEVAHNAGPSPYSTHWLVLRFGRTNKTADVARVCAEAVPDMIESRRYEMIEHCADNMNAATVATSMSWADKATFEWYLNEMERREQVEKAESARRARAEAVESARAEEAAALRRNVQRQVQVCQSGCRERALYCQNDCRQRAPCLNRCVQVDQACGDGCVSEGNRQLGL